MPSYLEPQSRQEVNMKGIENGNIGRDKKDRSGGMIDSGMVVVISIIMAMIFIVFFVLFTVKHEWCPVLFKNNTVSQQKWFRKKQEIIYVKSPK